MLNPDSSSICYNFVSWYVSCLALHWLVLEMPSPSCRQACAGMEPWRISLLICAWALFYPLGALPIEGLVCTFVVDCLGWPANFQILSQQYMHQYFAGAHCCMGARRAAGGKPP